MPFEAFKARVKIVKDEAVVKQWVEDHSFKNEYNCLNVPEPRKLANREEVARHFREVHLPNIVKSVDTHTFTGTAAAGLKFTYPSVFKAPVLDLLMNGTHAVGTFGRPGAGPAISLSFVLVAIAWRC